MRWPQWRRKRRWKLSRRPSSISVVATESANPAKNVAFKDGAARLVVLIDLVNPLAAAAIVTGGVVAGGAKALAAAPAVATRPAPACSGAVATPLCPAAAAAATEPRFELLQLQLLRCDRCRGERAGADIAFKIMSSERGRHRGGAGHRGRCGGRAASLLPRAAAPAARVKVAARGGLISVRRLHERR